VLHQVGVSFDLAFQVISRKWKVVKQMKTIVGIRMKIRFREGSGKYVRKEW